MWPLKSIILEKQALLLEKIRVSTHFYEVSQEIDYLGKTKSVWRVSTHIYGVFKEIDVKTFILE